VIGGRRAAARVLGAGALWSFRPPFLQADAVDLHPDTRVLLFTLGVRSSRACCSAGAGDSGVEAESRRRVEGEDRRAAGSNRPFSLRKCLVSAQIALSLVALIGAASSCEAFRMRSA
jgi:hypothetical protein